VLISSTVRACANRPASTDGCTLSHPWPSRHVAPSYSPVSTSAARWSGKYLVRVRVSARARRLGLGLGVGIGKGIGIARAKATVGLGLGLGL